ncbi:MAG: aspartyl/glutamyl-tRNA(Asn/Gln) amidotransferase subunit C [Verrucomicrobia bacterium 21-51-4]|nr:MAG: aspartyl/glutamyl-tRNA(Asn/Gln) amidotransferase subunit C [Verrucomicrobia bacterium 21-51-4]HQU08872.1 Asp-tRNA(Asn)/Glu-tRNA(Gln) amidotransferase subunit GatC [Opitutales bacterium]
MSEPIDIHYLAELARLALTPEEKARYKDQLSNVLSYVQQLSAYDLDNVEPTAHTFPVYNVWREDVTAETFTPQEALRNAPATRDNQVVVPKVVDEA